MLGFTVSELIEICMIGWSDGFTFCMVGGAGIPGGSFRATAAMPFCTSSAAQNRWIGRV